MDFAARCSPDLERGERMPKFLFHFVRQHEVCSDTEGVELIDVRAAHRHAVRLVDEIMQFVGREADCREWRIEVADDERRPVLTTLFPAAQKLPAHQTADFLGRAAPMGSTARSGPLHSGFMSGGLPKGMDAAARVIMPIAELTNVGAIDAGHTIVVRLRTPEDAEVVLLLPKRVAGDLSARLAAPQNPPETASPHSPPPR